MSLLEDTEKLIDMYKLGEVKKVLNIIDEELLKVPNTHTFRQRGIISINYEKKFGLKKFLEHIIKINPNDPEILSRLALIFELNGNIENASNFADKSLKIDSDNKTALQIKGIIAFNNDEYENSINYFEKILIKNENDSLALLNKGLSMELMGKSEEAMNCFKKLFNVDSLSNESLDSLVSYIRDLVGNDFANSYADQILSKQPDDKLALKIKDNVILEQSKVRQKIFELFNKYLHRAPDNDGLDYFEELIIQGTKFEEIEEMMKNSEEGKNYWN